MDFERGVILGPNFLRSEGGFRIHPNADATLLRHAVLYFDKIHWAQNSFMMGGVPADIITLYDAGIADARPTSVTDEGPRIVDEPWFETIRRGGAYPFPWPDDIAAAYFKAQAETFLALDQAEPEVWTMGGHAPMWEAPASVSDMRFVSEMRINATLPMPPEDLPIADAIDFKDRHKSKFKEFRAAIDQIHATIESSATPLRTQAYELKRLEAAIDEVRAVASANWMTRAKSAVTLDRTLSLKTVAMLTGIDQIIDTLAPATPVALKLAALAVATDKVKIDFKKLFAPKGLSDANKSFAYLLSLSSEHGLGQ